MEMRPRDVVRRWGAFLGHGGFGVVGVFLPGFKGFLSCFLFSR